MKTYTKEFKRESVLLLIEEGYTLQQASDSLGVTIGNLSRWKREYLDGKYGEKPKSLSSSERDELQKLRKENRQLRLEREILKKAAVFFAKEEH